jgi:tetratricopeptide (TPR) repeat protein
MASRFLLIPFWLGILLCGPALADGGGGGGGGGSVGSSMPSQNAPRYDAVAEYQKGVLAFQGKDFKAATTAFKRVVEVAPKHAPAQYLLGASYLGQGDFKKARKPLETAIKLDPALIDAQRDLGVTYARLGESAKATEQLALVSARKTECAATCPDAARLDAAETAIEAAIGGTPAVAPEPTAIAPLASVDAAYVAAVSLINEGRYEPAISGLQNALWRAGPHPDLITYLGFANRKLGHYDRAREWYEMALAIDPDHRGAIEYYGELKLETGDVAGAKAHLARLDALCGFGCAQADELRAWIEGRGRSAT